MRKDQFNYNVFPVRNKRTYFLPYKEIDSYNNVGRADEPSPLLNTMIPFGN